MSSETAKVIYMELQKKQMAEAALLYYEKKYTQTKVAEIMNLSRQTVSKLLAEAVNEKIVEIKINNPEIVCAELEKAICDKFKIKTAIVCGVSADNQNLCTLMTVKKAAAYILSRAETGGLKIGISWGRTIQMLIDEFPHVTSKNNVIFPLFGATNQEQSCFSSNELARSFADKTGSKVKYAWFPYRPDCVDDCRLFKKTSYYKELVELWNNIDLAVVGIGNYSIIQTFGEIFGYNQKFSAVTGDISTHFFNYSGEFTDLYENTLCASRENLLNAKNTIAIACGADKTEAIIGALRTKTIDTFITDEYTASSILSAISKEDAALS